MKLLKDGQIKLDAGEKRVGNFIIKEETAHIKIQDINGIVTHRVEKSMAIGQFLKVIYDKFERDDAIRNTLENYVAFLYSISCVIPDVEFLKASYESTKECIERHPELYGQPAVPQTDEADAEALRAIKEEKEFEAEVAATEKDSADADEGKEG